MKWTYDDGGRKDAGFKGDTRDCVVRSISIATSRSYQSVYDELNHEAKRERPRKGRKRSSSRTGVHKRTIRRYLDSIGWEWTPTMFIGSGCKVHLREDELPEDRLIVSLSRHMSCVIGGVIYDTHDPSREGTRCVYGYWRRPGPFRRELREAPLPKQTRENTGIGSPYPVEPEPFAAEIFPLRRKLR